MDPTPSGKDTWQEILNHALEGDMEQFGRLCQEYLRPKLYPYAVTLLNNRADAEEVVQEVFVRLMTHSQRIRKRALASIEAFVITMVKNACRDLWKTRRRVCISERPVDETCQAFDTTAKAIAHREIIRVINRMIYCELNAQEREIFSMKVLDGVTYREISTQTGIPLTTLHARVQDILTRIGRNTTLRAYWEEVKE